ncbi:MAG: hypothetical protein OYL41_02845 [Acidobacteriota bacterium]|nr:hypothetical protein [Acidobacteriota bacterium]
MIRTALRWSLVLLLVPALLLIPAPELKASSLSAIVSAVNALGGAFDVAAVVAAVNAVRTLNSQKITEEINRARQEALGTLANAALPQSFQQLSSDPADLLTHTTPPAWATSFRDPDTLALARELTELTDPQGDDLTMVWRDALGAADAIGEAEVQALYPTDPVVRAAAVERWRAERDTAERRLAADFAALDAARELAAQLTNTQTSIATLRAQTNLSGTALQQALLSAQLTQAELQVATNQLLALQAIRELHEGNEGEIRRRESLADWASAKTTAGTQRADTNTWLQANATALGLGLLLPSAYGPR